MKITLRLGKFFLIALATAMAFSCSVKAQSDNFDDGNDTVNPTWTQYDPIGDFFGVPNGSWTFPGSNTYRLQASASPDPMLGPGRIASTLTNVYSDFYSTVDVVDWDDSLDQAFGILARLENVGLGTTTGYVFTYQEIDHTVSISVINNEVAADITGTSTPVTLLRTNSYRFVFTGQGTNFLGWIYQLPDTSTPIVVVSGSDDTYSNGVGGLLAFDNSSGGSGTADVTYDNYFAGVHEPPPVIISIHNIANNATVANTIGVRFDQPLDVASATNPANYVVNAGTINVADVHLRPDGHSVEVVAGGPVGVFFSVCATNVRSLGYSSAPTIATGYTSEYSGTTIGTNGDPVADGQVFTSFWDTFEVTAGGSNIGGLDDHGHFIQQLMTGDFDVRVRVLQLEMADSASQAGLMARESLDANSASIQTFLTPTGGLNQIQATVRPIAGTDALDFLANPPVAADPNDWLRMTRSNDVFTAYYATNDLDWIVSGVTTQSFATSLYVGMAASAHTSVTNTTATFTDFYAQGGRPGDDIVPPLGISRVGTNIVMTWAVTPRSYALQVSTNINPASSNFDAWALLVTPIQLTRSNGVSLFQMTLPLSFFGKTLFLRTERVDKLIPDIKSIMVDTGIIVSPGVGVTASNPGGTICSQAVITNTSYGQTNSYVVFASPTSSTAWISTQESSANVNTLLYVVNKNNGIYTGCNDDATGVITSKVTPLPGASPAYTKYGFVAGAKVGSASHSAIKVWLNY